ncbi:MAG: hypothetical protein U1A28_03470, partial [Patescibacteria group bacterium]|nr:hypothetical protein [Patescibacteria group bacterium]
MKTIIHIKADREVKENAQQIAGELGLSLSAVMNAQLRQFIRSRALYAATIPRMSPELERLLVDVDRDIRRKKNFSPA